MEDGVLELGHLVQGFAFGRQLVFEVDFLLRAHCAVWRPHCGFEGCLLLVLGGSLQAEGAARVKGGVEDAVVFHVLGLFVFADWDWNVALGPLLYARVA